MKAIFRTFEGGLFERTTADPPTRQMDTVTHPETTTNRPSAFVRRTYALCGIVVTPFGETLAVFHEVASGDDK